MTQGRGAWTPRGKQNGSIYYQFKVGSPFDGTEPSEDAQGHLPEDPLGIEDYSVHAWYDRAHRGVKGLQILLRANGFTDAQVPLNGIFDEDLSKIVIVYQARYPERVGAADGLVGPKTMGSLMRLVIIGAATGAGINPRWMHGQVCKETQYDPGGQGQLNAPDSGIFQFNLKPGTDDKITDKELDRAYHPIKSAHDDAARIAEAWMHFETDNRRLRVDCTIAQHNSPVWAQEWFDAGKPPNSTIESYVEDVRGYARQWVA